MAFTGGEYVKPRIIVNNPVIEQMNNFTYFGWNISVTKIQSQEWNYIDCTKYEVQLENAE